MSKRLYNKIFIKRQQYKAFTLAEVLITLMVIGILAVVTIPSILQSWEEQATVAQVRKLYSSLSQAFILAEIQDGTVKDWGWGAFATAAQNPLSIFLKHMKVDKICNLTKGCFPDLVYKGVGTSPALNYNTSGSWARARLADQTSLGMISYSTACNFTRGSYQDVCGAILVDINGDKSPNQLGADAFTFLITTKGIRPYEGYNCTIHIISSENGFGCSSLLLKNGNMDYLRK
ncbi:MAG: prepilin-type N-terminal cleavage/methylation domain-containing protein [Candidatus Gastranaerophilales bacterium]|nr:prepilin-type N-terminal cleavage/methylation domain-containing protein [Candidatus Gastranaerophilales bacterium]